MFDVTFAGAGFAGLLSFLSPCILPIVPFYLCYMAGVSMNQMTGTGGEVMVVGVRRQAVISSIFFAAGVITIFMGLGATASMFGQLVREWMDVLRYLAAAIIFTMGLHFIGVIRIGILYRQMRAETSDAVAKGVLGAYVIGLAFAFGWTPCVGPVLAAILFTAAGAESASGGAQLLFAYGVGMTFPFILAAMFIVPFMNWMARFRRHLGTVEKVMGVFLIVFALLIATNTMNYIAMWMLSIAPDIGVLR